MSSTNLPKDPICGMPVEPSTASCVRYKGREVYFCSDYCRRESYRRPVERRGLEGPDREARSSRRIAYFSMEIALLPAIPTYAGGLGCWRVTPCGPARIYVCQWWPSPSCIARATSPRSLVLEESRGSQGLAWAGTGLATSSSGEPMRPPRAHPLRVL